MVLVKLRLSESGNYDHFNCPLADAVDTSFNVAPVANSELTAIPISWLVDAARPSASYGASSICCDSQSCAAAFHAVANCGYPHPRRDSPVCMVECYGFMTLP